MLKSNPTLTDAQINAGATFGIVVGIVVLALYVLLALQVRKGKNWARVVTWVLAGLGVLGVLVTLAGPGTAANKLVGLVSGVLDVGVIVLLASAASNAFFARRPPQGY